MSGKRKLTSLSFKEKKDLIALFEISNVSKKAFAMEHNIPRSTLNDILSSKEIILEYECKGKRKRMRKSKFDEIEKALVQWLKHAILQNVTLSTAVLKEKAMLIAEELNIPDFGGSNGWLERFKLRHGLTFKNNCRDAAFDGDGIEDWKNRYLKNSKQDPISSQTNSNHCEPAVFPANAESKEILSKDLIKQEPLDNLLPIANEKVYNASDFISIDNNITVCSQATVESLTSEYLDKKICSSEDSDIQKISQTLPSKKEAVEALVKLRKFLTSIQGTTDEEFKALNILERVVFQ